MGAAYVIGFRGEGRGIEAAEIRRRSQQTHGEPRGAESYEQQRTNEGSDAESCGASFEDGHLWIRRMNGDANAVTWYVSGRGATRIAK
jgi:hypothetical protein